MIEATEYAVAQGGRVRYETDKVYLAVAQYNYAGWRALMVREDGAVNGFGDSVEADIQIAYSGIPPSSNCYLYHFVGAARQGMMPWRFFCAQRAFVDSAGEGVVECGYGESTIPRILSAWVERCLALQTEAVSICRFLWRYVSLQTHGQDAFRVCFQKCMDMQSSQAWFHGDDWRCIGHIHGIRLRMADWRSISVRTCGGERKGRNVDLRRLRGALLLSWKVKTSLKGWRLCLSIRII